MESSTATDEAATAASLEEYTARWMMHDATGCSRTWGSHRRNPGDRRILRLVDRSRAPASRLRSY